MDKQDGQVELTEEQKQAFQEELAEVEAKMPIEVVLARVMSRLMGSLDRTSLALLCSGVEIGVELSGSYPEWTQALFLRLNPTPEQREKCRRGLKALPELIPMRIEQTREV